MIYGAKISGESLRDQDDPTATWSKAARLRTAKQLANLHVFVQAQRAKVQASHNVPGALVVIGAGNGGFRGEELAKKQEMDRDVADWIGLMGTAMNSMVVAADLKRKKVPHCLLRAATANVELPGMPALDPADPDRLQHCFRTGKLAIIAFGSGKIGQSTDSAVMDHLRDSRDATGDSVEAWKATKWGGVYNGDPEKFAQRGQPLPDRFDEITTTYIRAAGWTPVDPQCLKLIDETGVPMRLHTMDARYTDVATGKVGSLIIPAA